jgi:hypothetical protein
MSEYVALQACDAGQGKAFRGHGVELLQTDQMVATQKLRGTSLRYDILRKRMDDLLYDHSVGGWYSQRAERKLSLSLSLSLFWLTRLLSTLSTPQYSRLEGQRGLPQLIKQVRRSLSIQPEPHLPILCRH